MTSNESESTIVIGGGCFWCLEAAYQQLRGVKSVISGYAGGEWPNPTYERVCAGTTGHAEVVKVIFDAAEISLPQILDVFWVIHNPTTLNRQGYDVGSQYRSIILYQTEEQKAVVDESVRKIQESWDDPVVTEVKPLTAFYPAEEYHQNYFARQPQAAYCQAVINPKLKKLAESYVSLLKES